MDETKGKSAEIEEWMNPMLPDGAADIGVWQNSQSTSAERSTAYLAMDTNTYQCNMSQHQLVHQTSSGCNSNSLMVKPQDPFNVLQHNAGQATLHKIFETQSGIVPERGHPRVQMPAYHQFQNLPLADQLTPGNQTQAMFIGSLQDSSPQVDSTSSIDWVNQAYHEIQQMKEMYLPVLAFYRAQVRHRAANAEVVNNAENTRPLLEKIINFLQLSRSDLLKWRKENCYQVMNEVLKHLRRIRPGNSTHVKQTQQVEPSINHFETSQIQQRENYLQPSSLQLRQGGALSLPQSSLNSFKVGSSSGVHKVDASPMMNNASQYNQMRSAQQWTSQGCVVSLPHKSSQAVFDQRAHRMLLHPSNGVPQHTNLCTSQQPVAPSRNIFNSLDYSVSPISQTPPALISTLQNSQHEPSMKRQRMKQPVQPLIADKNKQQTSQKRNEDMKLRRFVGFNQRWSPVLPPSSSPYTISPQNSQQSSSQLELKDLSSKFSKSATPSQSASPSALPSPLTPLTPSSNAADSIKSPLIEESSKVAKTNAASRQLPLQEKNQTQVSTDALRLTKSCLHRESTRSHDKQSLHAKGDPLKRLVEVVKSISSRALSASILDIGAVTNLTDRTAAHLLHRDPTKVILHDLADEVSNCDHGIFQARSGTTLKMKRDLNATVLNDLITEMELYSSVRTKKQKIEPINLLLQEIKEINNQLIEVVVDVHPIEEVFRTGSDGGTLIRCSYIPIGFSRNINTLNSSKLVFPNLLLDLIVSANYPNSSPTVLESMPCGFSDGEDEKYLWMKAKSRFSLSLRKLSHPISVKQMAETWDICALEVFHEFAELMGGGNFSSTYGKWENYAVAV